MLTCSVVPNLMHFHFVCICVDDVSKSGGEEMRTMMLREEDTDFSRVKVILSRYLLVCFHTRCDLAVLHSTCVC